MDYLRAFLNKQIHYIHASMGHTIEISPQRRLNVAYMLISGLLTTYQQTS